MRRRKMTRKEWTELGRLARLAASQWTPDSGILDAVAAVAEWHGRSGDLEYRDNDRSL